MEIRQSVGDSGAERAVFFGFLDPQELLEAVDAAGRAVTYELARDSCKLTVESAGAEYLMLPVNADSGWHCTVNGEERAISRLAGNLMLVPLDEGTNEITLCYVPRGMKKGAAVTGMALMLLAGWAFYHVCFGEKVSWIKSTPDLAVPPQIFLRWSMPDFCWSSM